MVAQQPVLKIDMCSSFASGIQYTVIHQNNEVSIKLFQ